MISCSEIWPSSASRHQARAPSDVPAYRVVAAASNASGPMGEVDCGLSSVRWVLVVASPVNSFSSRTWRQSRMRFPGNSAAQVAEPSLSLFALMMARSGGGPFSAGIVARVCTVQAGGPSRPRRLPSRRPPRPAKSCRPTRSNYSLPDPRARLRECSWPRGSPAARPATVSGACRSTDRGTRQSRPGSTHGRPAASLRPRPSRCPRPPRPLPPVRPATGAPQALHARELKQGQRGCHDQHQDRRHADNYRRAAQRDDPAGDPVASLHSPEARLC